MENVDNTYITTINNIKKNNNEIEIDVPKNIILKRKAYENFMKIINKMIPEDDLTDMKPQWEENIYRLSSRAFKFNEKNKVILI